MPVVEKCVAAQGLGNPNFGDVDGPEPLTQQSVWSDAAGTTIAVRVGRQLLLARLH